MSIEDRIARSILLSHGSVLDNNRKMASGWWTDIAADAYEYNDQSKYARKMILLDGKISLECLVADTPDLQVRGLQGFTHLAENEGMMFPQPTPRKVSMHAGAIDIPIDVIYVDHMGRISKIMENITAEDGGVWSHPRVSLVLETNGGFCHSHGIEIGSTVEESTQKDAQLKQFDPATNTFVPHPVLTPLPVQKNPNAPGAGYGDTPANGDKPIFNDQMTDVGLEPTIIKPQVPWDTGTPTDQLTRNDRSGDKQAQERFSPDPRKDLNPKMLSPVNTTTDRFRDRDMLDVQLQNQPFDVGNYEQQLGWDISNPDLHDQPDGDEEAIPAIRPGPSP